jgi:lipopolysaccharide cholinephosphotransferase
MRDVPAGPESKPNGPPTLGDLPEPAPTAELRKLQLVELDILREFVRVCEAHGLRYYVAYGTLLGAVRHRGFIPWDDDVDVTMPRSDYNRFAEICGTNLRPGFRWQSYSTDEHYPHLFGKLLKDESVLRQAPSEHLGFQQSVYIDVFPLDGGADRVWAALAQRVIVRICRLRLRLGIKRGLFKRLLVQLIRVIPRSGVIAAFEMMTRSVPTDRSAKWICVGGPYGYRRQSFPSNWFASGAPQVFEGLRVVGPVAWDSYLVQLYADYMTPPPLSDRLSLHQVTEVELDRLPRSSATDDSHETGDDRRHKGRPFGG